ncbi:MAG: hypothetical protein ABWX92_03620 [Mycetocola sp.]
MVDITGRVDADSARRLAALSGVADGFDDTWHRRYVSLATQMARIEGDFPRALELTELIRSSSERARHGKYSMQATVWAAMGDFDQALDAIRRSVEELDGTGRTNKVFALSNYGYGLLVTGDYIGARAALEQGHQLALDGGKALELAAIEMNLAWLELMTGQPSDAVDWVTRTLLGQRGQADWMAFTEALLISASALLAIGRHEAMRPIAEYAVPRVLQHPELVDFFMTERANSLAAATGVLSGTQVARELDDRDLLRLIDHG